MFTRDVSVGGIRFFSDHFIKPQSVLKTQIAFECTKKPINAMATVKWIQSVYEDERYELGVEFIGINNEDIQFLNQYLSKQLQSS